MTPQDDEFAEPDLLRAMSHPLRVKILHILNEREASPNELEDILGEKLGHIAYHTRVLDKCHCLELTRTEQRRGAMEHFYRALPDSSMGEQALQGLPRSLQGSAALASLKVFVGKLAAAFEGGTIQSEDRALNSMTILLDEVGREEAQGIVYEAIEKLKVADKESRRRVGTERSLIPHVTGLALFEAAPKSIAKDDDIKGS